MWKLEGELGSLWFLIEQDLEGIFKVRRKPRFTVLKQLYRFEGKRQESDRTSRNYLVDSK